MSLRFTVSLMLGHAILAVFWIVLGWLWLTELAPSLPLVPAACFLLAMFSAGLFGRYFTELE